MTEFHAPAIRLAQCPSGFAFFAFRYFLSDLNDPEAFAACLHACCDLVKPDVAMELAWRHKVMDFIMPYLIHVSSERSISLWHKTLLESFIMASLSELYCMRTVQAARSFDCWMCFFVLR